MLVFRFEWNPRNFYESYKDKTVSYIHSDPTSPEPYLGADFKNNQTTKQIYLDQ